MGVKSKKIVLLVILVILVLFIVYPIGYKLGKYRNVEEELISRSLSSKRISILSGTGRRTVYNQVGKLKLNYSLIGVRFLTVEELLATRNTKFLSLNIRYSGDSAVVRVNDYKAGIMYSFTYVSNANSQWHLIESTWGRVKFMPSKPYYVYLENMRQTDKNYKGYPIDAIPRDSLK